MHVLHRSIAIRMRYLYTIPLNRVAVGPRKRMLAILWWTGEDSNLRSSQGAADLQSAAINHSATCPRFAFSEIHYNMGLIMTAGFCVS